MTDHDVRVDEGPARVRGGSHAAPVVVRPDSPWSVALIALGVLAVAVGYAMGRDGAGGATAVYWVGQLTIFVAALAVALQKQLTARSAQVMVAVFGLATALTKWMYSPFRLKFPDELQHLLGTSNLLAHGTFGASNRTLQISTQYPGLEAIAGVLCRISGMSIDAAGLLLGGIFHVATVCLMFGVLRRLTGSLRAGTIGVVAYGCNASFGFFNSMYVYENLAIVFALAALLAVMSLARTANRPERVSRTIFAVVLIVATIVSHHITAAGLCLALVVFSVVCIRRRGAPIAEGSAWRLPAVITAGTLVLTALWFSVVATLTWGYIEPYTVGFVGQKASTVTPRPAGGQRLVLPSSPPAVELGLAAIGLLALFVICVIGGIIELRRTHRIRLVYLAGAVGLGALEVGRLVSARGSEVAGRSAAFLYIPVAAAVGLTLTLLLGRFTLRPRAVAGVAMCLGWVGAILIAWPAWWDRLPGGSLIATQFERGNDEAENSAAYWARGAIAPNQPIAADYGAFVPISTRAGLVAVSNSASIFYASTMGRGVLAQLRERSIRYVWVNTKLPHTYSVDGSYYGTSTVYATAPTAAALAKFDAAPGVDRVYDNGEVVIYSVIGFETP